MTKNKRIMIIISIIAIICILIVWYAIYIGSNISNDMNEESDYIRQRYENQWFKNLNEIYKSDWYREKYQECIDSYKDKHCGIPEEMCTLDRLISGDFCN